MAIWVKAVWAWLCRSWRWLVGPLVGLVGGWLLFRRRSVAEAPAAPQLEPIDRDIERKAREAEQEATEARTAATQEYEFNLDEELAREEEAVKKMSKDPSAATLYVLDAGKVVRGKGPENDN